MNRSLSQTNISNRSTKGLNHQLSRRCIYINQQSQKKTQKNSIQTIFHSPYKDGRPNKQFSNPTFMSSDIIYHRQFGPFSSHTPKKAVIHTVAQNRQKALYNQRMRTMNRSQSFTNIEQRVRQQSKSLKKKSHIRAQQGNNTKVMMSTTLQNELQNLLQFKKERQLKECNRQLGQRFFRKTTAKKQKQLPIYFQKVYKNPNYIQQQQQNRRNEIQQWMGMSRQLQQIKQQIKRQKHRKQVNEMTKDIQNYRRDVSNKELMNRQNCQLLNRILVQQIRDKDRKQYREKSWRMF